VGAGSLIAQPIAVTSKRWIDKFHNSKLRVSLLKGTEPIKRYYAGGFDARIQQAIQEVAANSAVSQDVATKVQARLRASRLKLLRISLIAGAIGLGPHLAVIPLEVIFHRGYSFLSGDQVIGDGITNSVMLWEFAIVNFLMSYYSWRKINRLGRLAAQLINCLECGLGHASNPTDFNNRDRFAASLQRLATGYFTAFRQSSGPRYFKNQVHSTARICRDDVLSLLPSLVTADSVEISRINCDLTRLLIRSQLGYWYQTKDIGRPGIIVPKREVIRASLNAFIADRSIQVAVIAMFTALLSAIMPVILKH
jgi:hypothetical protein